MTKTLNNLKVGGNLLEEASRKKKTDINIILHGKRLNAFSVIEGTRKRLLIS
jgi:hypothetical protein